MKSTVGYLIYIAVAIVGTACSQPIAFKAGPVPGVQSSPTCQPGTTTTTKPTKFLFVVDQSGSNLTGPYEHPGVATDPQKVFRFGVINDFFMKQGNKAYVNWGFITFHTTTAQGLIGSVDHPIFSDKKAMAVALQTFLATPDAGDTPYKAALQMAHDMIQQDMASSVVPFQYWIAILTDGYPTDYCSDPTQVSCPGGVLENQIDSDVQNIINLSPQSVQMSAVYYGLPDATAASRLQRMARVGGGQFVDTNVTKVITLDDVIKVPTTCP